MILKAIFKLFRASEWWAYKLPGVLAVGYATSINVGASLTQVMPSILFVLVSIVIGAIYVSTINDLTDIDEDLRSGKKNRMARIPKRNRWMLPFFCAVIGLGFTYGYSPNTISAVLYVLPWIAFSLYSFEPIRLKQRGLWGLVADSAGAHVFINMLMVSHVSYVSGQSVDLYWITAVGVWSFVVGLRGILWHQFTDRDNDLKTQSTTFATATSPDEFKEAERFLFAIELIMFSIILFILSINILFIVIIFYSILTILRYKRLGYKMVVVLNPEQKPSQVLLLDFYQVFFPIALLGYICWTEPYALLFLSLHIILFPSRIWNILVDGKIILRSIFMKTRKSSNYFSS